MVSNTGKYTLALFISLAVHGLIMGSIDLSKERIGPAAQTIHLQLAATPRPFVPQSQAPFPEQTTEKKESEPVQELSEPQKIPEPIVETPVFAAVNSQIDWEMVEPIIPEETVERNSFTPEPQTEPVHELEVTDTLEVVSDEINKPEEPEIIERPEVESYETAKLEEPEITEMIPSQPQQLAINEKAIQEIAIDISEDAVMSYRETVRVKLEQSKRYPRRASRLGFEGQVSVRFEITPNGYIEHVVLSERSQYKALNKATEKLLQRVSPLPPPPAGLSEIEVIVDWSLDY